jgi:endothelin-converting enzyme/putative endopeptidase
MRVLKSCILLLALAAFLPSGQPQENKQPQGNKQTVPSAPTPANPPVAPPTTAPVPPPSVSSASAVPESMPGFDAKALDTSADPCVDFFQYACGTWMKNNPIPADRSRWGRFDALQERNLAILRNILEAASANNPQRDATDQKIGDFYAACMDEPAINRKGLAPLQPALDRIAALPDKSALVDEIARLHRLGVNALFRFGSEPDYRNSTQNIADADQGGLGLPDRDYYLEQNDKSIIQERQAYETHVRRMMELLGESSDQAQRDAEAVMRIETVLAKSSLDRTSRRNPSNVYHKMDLQEFAALNPSFAWPKYFDEVGAPPISSLNVSVPDFFKGLDALVSGTSLEDWKAYLKWHLVHTEANLLPAAFVDENFAFYGRTLTGARQIRPRWKRCVALTDNELGEALGKRFVELTFGTEGKERTLKMVHQIELAMGEDIQSLTWMGPETKRQALEKLHAITNKIGYPDKWRDYSSVHVVRDDALGNLQRGDEFEFNRDIRKINQPVDKGEWDMTPPTVNAYYSPLTNSINFPAGILQPPFYSNSMDDPVNYGAIGAVIGHELTHGFDDHGRRFDPHGDLRDWWTKQDAQEFEQRAQCLVDEYSGFIPVAGLHLNGKLTLGENTADNGGVRIAYMALMQGLAGLTVRPTDNFTPQQRFFLAYGQVWCQNVTPQQLALWVKTDPHSAGRFRVNGVLQNNSDFAKAFKCQLGQPMAKKDPCRVW